jgi:hypothetical protein
MISATIDEPVNSQAQLIFVAGRILVRLQFLENQVKLCCSFMEVDGKKETFENIFSEDPKGRHYTLGALIKLLKNPTCFKESFVSRLDKFVHNRNELIHNLWLENGIYSLDEKLSNDKFLYISKFLDDLSEETDYMTEVFIGFNYAIGVYFAQREGKLNQFKSNPENMRMIKYVPSFLSVVESG